MLLIISFLVGGVFTLLSMLGLVSGTAGLASDVKRYKQRQRRTYIPATAKSRYDYLDHYYSD